MNQNRGLGQKIFSRFSISNITVFAAIAVFILFFLTGSVMFRGFFSLQVLLNLLIDNAHLLIAALGGTMVFITGGIDLSLGAVVALGCTSAAHLLKNEYPVFIVIGAPLLIGLAVGTLNGYLITRKRFQPFIATLATQYLARGCCYLISTDTIVVSNPEIVRLSIKRFAVFGEASVSFGVIVALIVFVIFHIISRWTRFGRNVYAVGGNEQSANLMGLPVKRIKMQVYMLCGLNAGIASLVFMLYVLSAYGLHADTLHLDAVSSAVIGGTLTTGGVGMMVGTLFGVMTTGIIQTFISFQGTLTSWWTMIFIALLLLAFILLQRVIVFYRERNKISKQVESIEEPPEQDGGFIKA